MTPVSPGSGAWLARLVVGAVLMLAGILAVVYLAARFVVWPNVDALAARYAGTMEARLGAPVTWKAIRTDWAGLRPSIEIDGAMVGSGDRAIRAERLFATISLRALLRGEADFHELRLDRPVVPVSRRGDELTLSALPARPERPDGGGGVLPWLLQQSDVRIGGGTLVLRDEDQPRRSLQLRDISLVLKSRGVEHDARLDVGSGDSLAANLVVQAALTRDPSRDPSDRRSWSGSLQWEARQLMLRPLLDQLPGDLAETLRSALPAVVIDSVRGRVDPWMSVQLDRGIVGDVRVRLRSDDLALMLADPGASKPAAAAGGLRFTRLGTDLRIRRTPAGGIELSTYGFELEEAGGAAVRAAAPPLALVLAPDRSLERLSGGFDTFEAEPVLRLVRMFAAARATQAEPGAIERVAAAGQVSGLKLAWQRPTQAGAAAWSVEGAFERASLEVTPDAEQRKFPFKIRVPSLRAVSGTFLASQSGGRATLRTPPRAQADASAAAGTAGAGSASPGAGTIEPGSTASGATAVTFGGVLAEPEVPFTSLDSRFAWKVDRGAGPAWLTLSVERFSFANADGKGAITGSYRSGGRGAGVVDFRARIDSLQAKQVWRYLPHEVPEGVRQWVREALEAGTLEDIEAAWRGDIRDFPYRSKSQDGPGEFHLAGKARDVLFKYAADWPAIHGIAGDFEFDRASLRLQAQRATAMEVALAGIEARIDDLAQGILALQGRAEGDAGHMVRFVNASPLAAALGDVTRAMSAKGAAKLALELRLPLRDMDAFTV
ncbi:MAG: hypothetical protein GX652_01155, partial [Burkholderiaceae bacterium]|nr:hypothetical protein [Burkholderiaceae bacterium]